MDLEKLIVELQEFQKEKSFNTRGLPFAKKMWRDGYNKALQDTLIHFKILLEREVGDKAAYS